MARSSLKPMRSSASRLSALKKLAGGMLEGTILTEERRPERFDEFEVIEILLAVGLFLDGDCTGIVLVATCPTGTALPIYVQTASKAEISNTNMGNDGVRVSNVLFFYSFFS